MVNILLLISFGRHPLEHSIKTKCITFQTVDSQTLRKKCLYSELFWSAFFPHFLAFGPNTERYGVSLLLGPNARKCGKMRTRITPNTDTFYAVRTAQLWLFIKGSATNFSNIFCVWFFKKNCFHIITNHCLVAFTSWDIG